MGASTQVFFSGRPQLRIYPLIACIGAGPQDTLNEKGQIEIDEVESVQSRLDPIAPHQTVMTKVAASGHWFPGICFLLFQ